MTTALSLARTVIVLLGGPGAGKGTQAQEIAARLKYPHISTGELLRAEVAAGSEIGLRAKAVMDAGNLVRDEIVNELIAQRIKNDDCNSGFILDGYPRERAQALALEDVLSPADRLVVLDIDIDLERVVSRLTGRRTCKTCNGIYHIVTSPPRQEGVCDICGDALIQRSDDREETIRERFKTYSSLTRPLTDLYKEWGVYHRIDGMQFPEAVARDIRRVLETEIRYGMRTDRAA